jgi:hypothetical protein
MPESRIVDANAMRSTEILEPFLLAEAKNRVLVTDFCAMEAYKGSAEVNLLKSLSVLRRFPGQVAVLRGTQQVIALTNAAALDPQNFIDVEQTVEFSEFCGDVQRATDGDSLLLAHLRAHASASNTHLERLRKEAAVIRSAVLQTQAILPSATLKRLRRSEPPTDDDADVFIRGMLAVAKEFCLKYAGISFRPSPAELSQSFLLRYAVASYLLLLHWIRHGGITHALEDTLANDVVDMNYVAYSTYFDGILSRDQKLLEISRETAWYVREVFGAHNSV